MKRTSLVSILVTAALASGVGAVAYLVNVHEDREAVVTITGPVRVCDRGSPAGFTRDDEGVIEILHNDDPVRVMRIHYGEDYEAIRARLRDGREGYIFCCENFEISR